MPHQPNTSPPPQSTSKFGQCGSDLPTTATVRVKSGRRAAHRVHRAFAYVLAHAKPQFDCARSSRRARLTLAPIDCRDCLTKISTHPDVTEALLAAVA